MSYTIFGIVVHDYAVIIGQLILFWIIFRLYLKERKIRKRMEELVREAATRR